MKKFQYIILGVAALTLGLSSCTDYLDKEPDSIVGEGEAFKNFTNFQGFVEEIYDNIPNKESCYWCTSFNWGEDEIMNAGMGDTHVTAHFDLGDYRHWYDEGDKGGRQSWLNRMDTDGSNPHFNRGLCRNAWKCIRKANLGLENLDKMTDATTEEKNFIAGQLYFFRAWWHEELIAWFGGLPYVDSSLPSDEVLTLPRLSYRECAEKCAEDFRKAADLLPADWDKTTIGRKTLGKNDLRVNKAVALAYLGKVQLWAASPLWESWNNGPHMGALKDGTTYKYNKELAQKAADALGECIALVESGATPYSLADYSYAPDDAENRPGYGVYDHIAAKGSSSNYSEIFCTVGQGWKLPGSVEAMFRNPTWGGDGNYSNWNFSKLWGPKVNGIVEHDAVIHMPTANYVDYAYGMANGEPILNADGTLNPNSGFDPTQPYANRDPRFYHDIVFDGFKFLLVDPNLEADVPFQYMEMFTGGNMVPSGDPSREADGSRTGYFCQKLVRHQNNKYDKGYDYGNAPTNNLPYLRLADVYVMYAEAGAAVSGAQFKSSKCSLTAEDAINVLRDRVGCGHVTANWTGTQQKFIDEVRRERACELAFEGMRWNDLQRWLLLTEYPYNIKTRAAFYRAGDYDFANEDPRYAKKTGWKYPGQDGTIILTRNLGAKHYLLPLNESEVFLYSYFPQNPGW